MLLGGANQRSFLWIQNLQRPNTKGCLQHHGLCQRVIIMQLQESLDEIPSFWSPHFLMNFLGNLICFFLRFTCLNSLTNLITNQQESHNGKPMPSVTSNEALHAIRDLLGCLGMELLRSSLDQITWTDICPTIFQDAFSNKATTSYLLDSHQGHRKEFYNENSRDFEHSSVPWTHVAWLSFVLHSKGWGIWAIWFRHFGGDFDGFCTHRQLDDNFFWKQK